MGDDLSNKRSLSKIARPNARLNDALGQVRLNDALGQARLTGRAGIFIRAGFGACAPHKSAALLFGLPVKT